MNFKFFILTFGFAFSTFAFGFGQGNIRSSRPQGLHLTFNGEPAPSAMGLQWSRNVGEWLRFHIEMGGYNDWMSKNNEKIIPNYFIRPVAFGISYTVVAILTAIAHQLWGAKIVYLKYSRFLSNLAPETKARWAFSYGGGMNLFIPGLALSPMVGINWAQYRSSGHPMDLKDKGNHVYYSLGVDWQTSSGWHLQGGYHLCDVLSNKACGFFGKVGYFF